MPKSDRLARIAESRRIERLIPRLQPEVLHRLIQRRGLADCVDIVALATPEQLMAVFDVDLYRSSRQGGDETLDAERFGLWLEVLMEAGVAVAAEKLMAMDAGFLVGALAQHIRVFDRAATARDAFEIGGYVVEPRQTSSWDAIVALLLHLDSEHHDDFNCVMRGCRELSNAGFELDGVHDLLGDSEQHLFDVAFDREQRREKQGYVTPAQARAFLQLARERPREGAALERNPIAAAYLRGSAPVAGLIRAHDHVPSDRALEELAFLANVLMAGGAVDGRAFTPEEASRAAAAVCTLGGENAASTEHDVIRSFEIGWRILYEDVCLGTASRLVGVLGNVRVVDPEIQSGIDALRLELTRSIRVGAPWRARDALDVIMTLDMTAWAALRGLIAECPVIHVAINARGCRSIDASAFEFIATNAQLASIRGYQDGLSSMMMEQPPLEF